jgi:glycosyltransferase involved in cell wall biosynthesis
LANRQLGVLVHSDYGAKAIREVLDAPVSVVKTDLPTMVPEMDSVRQHERIVIGLAGAIAGVKGLDVIKAIADDPRFADCDIHLFGYGHATDEQLAQFASNEHVTIATNVTDYDFQTSFAKLDIFVNYRMIYKGETSNTTLEAMRYGVVPVVRKVGWFDELPDDIVVKVESPEAVIDSLLTLVQDGNRLRELGERAKSYVAARFTPEQYVNAMKELLASQKTSNPNTAVAHALRAGKVAAAKKLLVDRRKDR